MLEESCGAMEKKVPSRQSPAQPSSKNNGVISEKKSDYVSNKSGRQRKYKQANNGGRTPDLPQNSKPALKFNQSYVDKRPRSRSYYNDRQSEEVVEVSDELLVAEESSSRKGNANYLLQFSFTPRGDALHYYSSRGSGGRLGRNNYWPRRKTQTPRYSPEQFLQASCQFIVREGAEYTEQAINPDALVDWNLVEQVRTFNVEPVVCPICLQTLAAGKITKCGHVYCWSCILHHLQEKESMCKKLECPICPHRIESEELRSVQCLETRDYKVGDEIEMTLMRKSKGSVYVCPKSEWRDREGVPHNMDDGAITQYMKLLSASVDQIQKYVIDQEKQDLSHLLHEAEEYEVCFIQMAQNSLQQREENLKFQTGEATLLNSERSDKQADLECVADNLEPVAEQDSSTGISSEPSLRYADAFEDEVARELESVGQEESDALADPGATHTRTSPVSQTETQLDYEAEDTASSPRLGQHPFMNHQYDMSGHLTPEEAADHLELPEASYSMFSPQRNCNRTKDTYYFYQASSGQHVYLNSLNAQCLTKEYGSLENSPDHLRAKVVAIERIFMTEDVRKRLRYLNHIPLTCEFHVVELKFLPPLISRDTFLHFQAEFDKRRRTRQRKKKEEKERSKQREIEHKKSFGIYPEVEIPLDNLTQFPAYLGSPGMDALSDNLSGDMKLLADEAGAVRRSSSSLSEASDVALAASPCSPGLRQRNDSEGSLTNQMSFAQMLKAGKSAPQVTAWGRAPDNLSTSVSKSPGGKHVAVLSPEDDDEDLPAPPIASSWFDGISKALDAHIQHQTQEVAAGGTGSPTGGKKKKKKEKQLLFSTSMARKGS